MLLHLRGFSLVRNWGNEVQKWAGVSLYGRTIVAGKSGQAGAQAAADFCIGLSKRFSLLITSYDLYRSHSEWINKTEGLGLLVCDEAHRLKVVHHCLTYTDSQRLHEPQQLQILKLLAAS